MTKNNYHTHTERCKHASGSDEAFVLSAIKAGIQELGFSDHTPWNYAPSTYKGSNIRMFLDEFAGYKQSILALKEKYKDQISIKLGLEVEYFPKFMDWFIDFIKKEEIDYVILGNHFHGDDEKGPYYGHVCDDDAMLELYKQDTIKALKTGIYSYLAHPDLFMRGRKHFDAFTKKISREICEACKEMDIPLEYNLAGAEVSHITHQQQYPHPDFWQIAAEVGNKAIIGFDAHNNRQLENEYYYNQAKAHLDALGMEVIDTINFLR
ncbi:MULTISPECIES: histidinol-phosphatase [unclassified Breznakia]|uniref:histidinol-phosphatase n=1 Tax=unclassified Breznakia TaxID=2623764 RepID=UPI002476DF8F|nr:MULTISPECIES: histidinol-phosphatase [unclassified Breznakia]MDH6366162.1 histidinol-phosphatase (PHP family) [Breznakia sp. PH1-1]MDH6403255.1 histidinol-phosphatase (PHP family) [Breznakia sp. PF1-11]MDH6410964.1 histidinol-phosphatase (PHP family) [Breznakia sp. PFB1-11]MDH6413328.1 histidinol-phosphatase (PHP family) [Breznakia sp. PFB1-14]MDH6416093.1 histidinol-phosphatase (PHP family) [Breznakia sp. PFB1-4]